MTDKVRLVGVHDQPMFSPAISVRMRSGETISGVYPYARMAWMFDELVENLGRCTPRMPGGEERLASLVALVGGLEGLASVSPLIEAMVAGSSG